MCPEKMVKLSGLSELPVAELTGADCICISLNLKPVMSTCRSLQFEISTIFFGTFSLYAMNPSVMITQISKKFKQFR